jgi:hypothetical protein
MPGSIIATIQELMRTAREVYGVNPIIFLAIYFGCAPIFYYSLYRTLRAAAAKQGNQVMLWSAIFLGSNVAPFVYVFLFGHNIPWWVYAVIAVLVGQGVLTLALRVRKSRGRGAPPGDA